MIHTICTKLPIGDVYISEEDGQLTAVSFQKTELTGGSELLKEAERQLNDYVKGIRTSFDLPLKLNGTKFQTAVWQAMQKIEYGCCVSYRTLAEMAGYPKALRAVGTACGKNPIAIVIPCHRVIRSDGLIGNYAFGSELKQFLINLEKEKKQ